MEDSDHEWLRQCVIPDTTELQEHTLMTERSIFVGDRCRIDYGLKGEEIIVCEFSTINGDIHAAGDVRIDNWCVVSGDVFVEENAYLGEGVRILGRLIVKGDLDIGDNVTIDKGFEARGWISIRNQMPVVAYLVLYLITLLGIDKEEDITNMLQKLFGPDEDKEADRTLPLIIPSKSVLNMDTFSVPGKLSIGSGCRLHGNIRAGSIYVKEDNIIFGSLKASGPVTISAGTAVHGDVSSSGEIQINTGVHLLGDIRCKSLVLDENACVDGIIKAPEGIQIRRDK